MTEKKNFFERTFKLSRYDTSVKQEAIAGMTTFMTMSYILVVVPQTLAKTGMDYAGLFTAVTIATIIGTLVGGLCSNLPIALAPGLGLSAYFTYSVVISMGVPWQTALTAVFVEGIIFIILTLTNVREAIVNAIPQPLRYAISAGVGMFIAFIGLSNVGIVVQSDSTPLALGNLVSVEAAITVAGVFIVGILLVKNKNYAMLAGIAVCTALALIFGVCALPDRIVALPASIGEIAFQFSFEGIGIGNFIGILFTFLFVDMFDTLGTLMGVAEKGNMVEKDGTIRGIKGALMGDAIGTTAGALLGVSTVGAYVESASGIAAGGRTALTSVFTALGFGLAIFLGPIFMMVPSVATSPVLIVVGVMMAQPVTKIDFRDYTIAIPCFLAMVMMPLSYSIAEGISFGCISYAVLKLLTGRGKECSITLYILAAAFLCKYIFL
ncbi:MAG: NCS2 family permease [Bacillota bacterium]|nr:NCS2 family permease [Bacillota bacterium]